MQTVVLLDAFVGVPRVRKMAPSRIELDESNPSFYESSSHQAIASELIGRFLAYSIGVLRRVCLFGKANCFGRFGLHSIGEFVGLYARGKFVTAWPIVEMLLIEL